MALQSLQIVRAETELSAEEKAFLNAVEKGDYATVKQALQEAEIYYNVNINCMDPLGRSALLIAIENENLEIMELLLNHSVYVGDALLYAIRKEVVGAVELLLSYRRPSGEKQVRIPYSWGNNQGQDSIIRLSAAHLLSPARILCPWDFPDKNTEVGCHYRASQLQPT